MKLMIGVIGTGTEDSETFLTAEALAAAEQVGKAVAEHGAVLASGGMGGIMEAASKGASQNGGLTLGFLPGTEKSAANPYIDLAITTGMGLLRNFMTIRSSDAVIMINGGVGTLNELTILLMERTTPVVVLEGSGGWANRVRAIAYDEYYLDERRAMRIHFASTPQAAVELAMELARALHSTLQGNGTDGRPKQQPTRR